MKGVCATIVAVEKQWVINKFCVCVCVCVCVFICSLRYPTCNRHGAIFSSVACMAVQYFPHYLVNGMI